MGRRFGQRPLRTRMASAKDRGSWGNHAMSTSPILNLQILEQWGWEVPVGFN